MPERAFSTALLKSVATGRQDEVMAREVVRRVEAGQVPIRDAQALLLETRDLTWQPARDAVLRWLTGRPEFASAVLATHTQLLMMPPPQAQEQPTDQSGFTCRATVALPTGAVEGPWRTGPSRKATRQQAMLSLVARLAGMELPDRAAAAEAAPRIEDVIPHGPLAVTRWTAMGRDQFSGALQALVASGAPEEGLQAELEDRTFAGRVTPKDWLAILTQGGPPWQDAKLLAVRAMSETAGLAANILNLLRQQTGAPPAQYSETRTGPSHTPVFEVTASLATAAGPVAGRPQRAGNRKAAQDQALASLLAVIAEVPDQKDDDRLEALPKALRRKAGGTPLVALNGITVAGLATSPVYDFEPLQGVVRCRARTLMDGRLVEAIGTAGTKQDAKTAAVNRLLVALRDAYLNPTQDAAEAAPPGSLSGAVPTPRAEATALHEDWASPRAAVGWALDAGCALLFQPTLPGRLLVYRPDGSPVHQAVPPAPLTPTAADTVLLGPTGKPWRTTAPAWAAPLDLLLPFLTAPSPSAHPAVAGWAAVVRLALQVVAVGAVVPSIDTCGRDAWRPAPGAAMDEAIRRAAAALPPFAHAATAGTGPLRIHPALPAVQSVLDDLIESLVRTPGSAVLHGEGAFASAPAVQDAEVQQWADDVERDLDPLPEPKLVLTIQAPGPGGPLQRDGEPVLRAHVAVRDGTAAVGPVQGRGARRVLRRGAAAWPPLARLAHSAVPEHIELGIDEIADLLGPVADLLEDAGIHLRWPPELTTALDSYTVLGAGSAAAGGRGLSMEAMLDWRWQLTLDGADLTEAEMDALAEAARPLVRLRDRWLLADPLLLARARSRYLGQLPTREALTSALAGALFVDGVLVPCRPADGLAAIVTALREGPTASPHVPPPPGLKATLRPYQQRGFEWMVQLRSLQLQPLNADDMGLGKTMVTLAYLLHQQAAASDPVLVVCPTSLMDVWERHAAEFAPSLRVARYHGPGRCLPPDLGAETLVVTTYGTLVRDGEHLAGVRWAEVVADEAHVINSGTSQAALAIRALPAAGRVALTGTPVENATEEFWAIEDWLNPGLFGSRRAFRELIGRHTAREADGDAAKLLKRIASPFTLRRLKTDPQIAPDLPAKVQVLHPVVLSAEQAALYEAVVRETLEDLRSRPRAARAGRVLALLHDLRQIVNDPALFMGESVEDVAADLPRARARSAKLNQLLDLVAVARAVGEQVVVSVNYLPIGELLTACLTAAGHRAEFFQGSTPARTRSRMVEDFQSGRLPVLVLSVKAGGTGLTLTAASEVIHYDSPWTNTAREQMSDRAHRLGQTRTVRVRRLVAAGTVEERIEGVVDHKARLGDAVLPSGESVFSDMDELDLTALVVLGGQR
ncbi:SNF2-related protein [Kitasatospora purpeofusca]|uniref:DEAD/DEAH box helicase n=1 Tax=Kitasatospora purpeofusca TaxID=67352 RepID=UPI0035D84708